jgi:hypothetical protein
LEYGKLEEVVERSSYLLCQREENEVHIRVISNWRETSKWREELLRRMWIEINEEIRYRKITISAKNRYFRSIWKYLIKVTYCCETV